MNISGDSKGKIGEVEGKYSFRVSMLRALPHCVSPSDTTEITFDLIATSSILCLMAFMRIFISSACSGACSRLHVPEIKMGRALYTRLDSLRIPKVATVA